MEMEIYDVNQVAKITGADPKLIEKLKRKGRLKISKAGDNYTDEDIIIIKSLLAKESRSKKGV